MELAVVGGGPGGSWAAILLARRGHNVTLIDPQAPWEKPCGGGITTKALTRFGIFESDLPRKSVERITVFFGDKHSISVVPESPLAVVSRRELGQYLLDEARRCGVRIVSDRVTQIHDEVQAWRIRTRQDELHAEYLIGADGARSFVRRTLGKSLQPEDLCITLGYFIPGDVEPHMKIYFVASLEGYIW